jgi:hypothetical protein
LSAQHAVQGRVGRFARLGISLQVLLTAVLALAAVVMINWLAGRRGIRQRIDMTAHEVNTLAQPTRAILGQLPEDQAVTMDIFFRPMAEPLAALSVEVELRTYRLLMLMDVEAGEALQIVNHDMSDARAVQERLSELRIRGFENCVVVSCGDQRAVVKLVGDLAQFDIGEPGPRGRPPSILAYEGEAALVEAVLEVTRGQAPHLYFSWGHGELDPYGDTPDALGKLHTDLIGDGFSIDRWTYAEDGPLPDDCAALAVLEPESPFSDEELANIREYVDAGGRLVIAPHYDPRAMEASRVPELLEHFGLEASVGWVMMQRFDPATGVALEGPENSQFMVPPSAMARHEILAPYKSIDRGFVAAAMHPMRHARQPERGVSVQLFKSGPLAWLDMPNAQGQFNFKLDELGEQQRAFELAVASEVLHDSPGTGLPDVRTRIVALGSAQPLTNRYEAFNLDLGRNVFNWVTEREYRLSISPRDPGTTFLTDEGQAALVTRVAMWLLPGLCLALGVLTAILRARGGPRRKPA